MDQPAPPILQLRGAAFRYPAGGFALHVPALEVRPGERVAVVGPSGAGKSTLVHLLAGILPAASGEVEFLGLELGALTPQERRELRILRMGLVFQELELLEYLDALDNVLLPYRLTPLLRLDGRVRARGMELLAEVGLGDRLDRFPGELSQGERQRVALCRALITSPPLILGDEPTGNLDEANRDQVADLLFRYADDTGATVILVSHDPVLVSRFPRRLDVRDFASGHPGGGGAR